MTMVWFEACQENAITLVMNDTYGDGWNGATFIGK